MTGAAPARRCHCASGITPRILEPPRLPRRTRPRTSMPRHRRLKAARLRARREGGPTWLTCSCDAVLVRVVAFG